MTRSSSKTTSSSDTTEAPGDLVISGAPGRIGTYLYLQRGSVMYAIARFRDEKAIERFREWARQMDKLDLGIVWKGEEEDDSEAADS